MVLMMGGILFYGNDSRDLDTNKTMMMEIMIMM